MTVNCRKIYFSLFFLLLILAVLSCGSDPGEGLAPNEPIRGDVAMIQIGKNPVEMYSSLRPGKWADVKDQHEISVEINQDSSKKIYILKAGFPFESQIKHYGEVVSLFDSNMERIDSVSLTRLQPPSAEFIIEKSRLLPVYVIVIKCNKHGMWIKRYYPEKKYFIK